MTERILLAEDDAALNALVEFALREGGYEVVACKNGAEALQALERQTFDMILTDIMMPGADGFALAEAVRKKDTRIPILFMTAKSDKYSQILGYRLGIDDYIVKPFDVEVLTLKVDAVFRRTRIEEEKQLCVGNLTMKQEEHTAYVDGKELPLTVREFDLLYKMLSNPKRTFTRSVLMDEFWDFDSSATSRTVDVCMAKLREKTAACDGFKIVTVHGLGYKAVPV